MERITKANRTYSAPQKDFSKIVAKLGEYEDTGKTPEEIKRLSAGLSILDLIGAIAAAEPQKVAITSFEAAHQDAFADCTDEQLDEYIKTGAYKTLFRVGSVRVVKEDDRKAAIVLIGIDHDSDEYGKAIPLTVMVYDLLPKSDVMNDEWTNKGGWEKSKRRAELNGVFIDALPSAIKDRIVPTVKLTSKGESSKTLVKTLDKIFIPSEIEVFGKVKYSYEGEGEQYDFFKNKRNRVMFKEDADCSNWWWTRSPYSGYYNYFVVVSSDGSVTNYGAYYTGGVAPCFAISHIHKSAAR